MTRGGKRRIGRITRPPLPWDRRVEQVFPSASVAASRRAAGPVELGQNRIRAGPVDQSDYVRRLLAGFDGDHATTKTWRPGVDDLDAPACAGPSATSHSSRRQPVSNGTAAGMGAVPETHRPTSRRSSPSRSARAGMATWGEPCSSAATVQSCRITLSSTAKSTKC